MSVEKTERIGKEWLLWGPYLAERQWGTVREDYSADGAAWDYFTHDMAEAARIAGAKMESVASQILNVRCASRSHFGTKKIRY